jgi:hypothetical protein
MAKLLIIGLLILGLGCTKSTEPVEGNSNSSSRLSLRNEKIQTTMNSGVYNLKNTTNVSPTNTILFLDYIASLEPPSSLGVQATSSEVVEDDKLVVVYNKAGSEVGGGIDLISLNGNLQILDTLVTTNAEYSLVHEFNGFLLLGGQCINSSLETQACLQVGRIVNSKIVIETEVLLSSYYVTGIASYGDVVIVSTGDTGDVYVFEAMVEGQSLNFSLANKMNLPNILDVKTQTGQLIVLYGDDSLNVLKYDLLNSIPVSEFSLANIRCNAPTKIHLETNKTYINSCDGSIFEITDDIVKNYSTNGRPKDVLVFEKYLISSMGDAGLCSYEPLEDSLGSRGCFDFLEDSGSSNSIKSNLLISGESLFVLSDGLGGTKILKNINSDNSPVLEDKIVEDIYFVALDDNSKAYNFDNVEVQGALERIRSFVFASDFRFFQSESELSPLGESGRINFDRVDGFITSEDELLDDNQGYLFNALVEIDEMPQGISSIFSSDDDSGMNILLDKDGRVFVEHAGTQFLASDISLAPGKPYLIEVKYDPAGESFMNINYEQVGISTTHPDYKGGRIILGTNNYPSFLGSFYRFSFGNDGNDYSISEWAKNEYSLSSPFDADFDLTANLVLSMKSARLDSIELQGDKVLTWNDLSSTGCVFTALEPKYQPTLVGDGIKFSGKNFLECAKSNVLGGGEYTKIAVVEFDRLNEKNNILSSGVGNAHAMYMGDSANPQLWHSHYRFNFSQESVSLNQKVLILMTYGDGRVENLVYINNTLGATTPDEKEYDDPKLEIGSHGGGNFLHGTIYELQVYDKALNAKEREAVTLELLTEHDIQ